MLSILKQPTFLLFFIGNTISLVGFGFINRALGFLGKRDFPLESFGGDQHVLREDVDIVDLLF